MTTVTTKKRRIAVVLFNLGGPDRPTAVRSFLFNLFNDPAILRVPGPLRALLAHLIAARRAKTAARIYEELGGGSPLLPNTRQQAMALEARLNAVEGDEHRVFIAMRYWHPMSLETALAVQEYAPDRIVLLPLYPQWSTTTSASSIKAWSTAAAGIGLTAPVHAVCCYPFEPGFIAALAETTRAAYREASAHGKPRVLFSAHGLPERVVAGGDPYQWHCEQTAAALVAALGIADLDYVSCYQSRVGPLTWIGPGTDDEIRRAGRDGAPVVLVPIAFVSEHSETLVELDVEYRNLSRESGVPAYVRVPTVGTAAPFIDGLAGLVRRAVDDPRPMCSQLGRRLCPSVHTGCPHPTP
jgi:protoporphyrin/coproporphyrin ferrochelatase